MTIATAESALLRRASQQDYHARLEYSVVGFAW